MSAAPPSPEDAPGAITATMHDVDLGYDGHVAVTAAELTLRAGTVTAFIGPNGAGKSTLLSALAGLLPSMAGQVQVLGGPPGTQHRRVAYVLQSTAVSPHVPITVAETVAMGRFAHLGPLRRMRAEDKQAVAEAMERLAVTDLANRQIHELSGGQRQRVFVAQGLAQEADLLLLDEPVSGLDAVSTDRILTIVSQERDAGRTVVVSTHDLSEAAGVDQLVLLAGRVVAAGPAEQVLTEDNLALAYGSRLVRLPSGRVLVDDGSHHHHSHEGHHHRDQSH